MSDFGKFTFPGKGGPGTGITFDLSCHLSHVRCPVCGDEISSTADPREVFSSAEDYWETRPRPAHGWHFNSAGNVEVRCGCGVRGIDPTTLHFRSDKSHWVGKYPSVVAKLGVVGADWVGFYGSPDSRDEDVALVFLGGIPKIVQENWAAILTEVKTWVDLIAVGVQGGNVTELLTADSEWPHPVEDVQNCLHHTVPALVDKIRYVPPAERDIAAKEAQCRAWLTHYKDLPRSAQPALNAWAKRAGFIGLQLLALKWGRDAGYTKGAVASWAKENLHHPNPDCRDWLWLPPTDHPVDPRERHDHGRTVNFLRWTVDLEDTGIKKVHGARVVEEGKSYGSAPRLVTMTYRWEPETPHYLPPRYEEVERRALGTCPLCGQELEYPEVYPTRGIYFSAVLVHPACAKAVRAGLVDLSDGRCHLEFGEDGTPYWVVGEYFSASRIEFGVWDTAWELVEKTSGAPDYPDGHFR